MRDEFEAQALDLQEGISAMADEEPRRAYLECEGECGNPMLEALVLADEERNIDL